MWTFVASLFQVTYSYRNERQTDRQTGRQAYRERERQTAAEYVINAIVNFCQLRLIMLLNASTFLSIIIRADIFR